MGIRGKNILGQEVIIEIEKIVYDKELKSIADAEIAMLKKKIGKNTKIELSNVQDITTKNRKNDEVVITIQVYVYNDKPEFKRIEQILCEIYDNNYENRLIYGKVFKKEKNGIQIQVFISHVRTQEERRAAFEAEQAELYKQLEEHTVILDEIKKKYPGLDAEKD